MDERIKKALRFIFSKPPALPLIPGEENLEPIVNYREPTPDELALGFAEGKDEEQNRAIYQAKFIPQSDRNIHFYVVGASGSGKTKFLQTLIWQDIKNGNGFGIIDPHGDLVDDVKGYLYLLSGRSQEFLHNKVVLIDPTDPKYTVGFNPLERIQGMSSAELAAELVNVFKKIWHDAWGARMEDLLKNSLIALIENNLTLAELWLFLTDREVRRKVLEKVEHPICRQYFERFNSLREQTQNEWMESTLNKSNAFMSDERVRQMFAVEKSTFNLREIIDNKKILLVRLDKGRLKESADLLGSLLLAKIQMAAFTRTDIPQSKRVPFYLYIDEFQNFATDNFIEMLAEARKYELSLVLAHQNLAQLTQNLRASILTNCRIQTFFRISRDDSNILAKEALTPIYANPPGWEFYIQALQQLPDRACIIRKSGGGVVPIRTFDLDSPWKLNKTENEEEFAETIKNFNIGMSYLVEKEKVEKEYQKRQEELTKIDEPETFKEPK